jgi:hypothetical protein
MSMTAYGSRGRLGCCISLLYQDGKREHEDRRHRLASTLSKFARLGSVKVNRVRDLGCLCHMLCGERLRT